VHEGGSAHLVVLRVADRHRHGLAHCWVVENPIQKRAGDEQLNDGKERFFHAPNRSFHRLTDNWISSTVRRGLISQTNKQFAGRSGTSFSRSTMPVKGAWWSCPGHLQSWRWQPKARDPIWRSHSAWSTNPRFSLIGMCPISCH